MSQVILQDLDSNLYIKEIDEWTDGVTTTEFVNEAFVFDGVNSSDRRVLNLHYSKIIVIKLLRMT